MNIPQSELDKLNDSTDGIFDEHVEEEPEEEEVIEKVEEEVSASTDKDAVADEARVPYSRFETVNERAIRAEERLKLLEEQVQSKTTESKVEGEIPEEWVELYGDSDAAKRAYQVQLKINEDLQERATQNAIDRIDSRGKEEREALDRNLESIDSSMKEFSDSLGRKLNDTEENAILDIQDEFTQKDENGNYLTPLLSPEKAFEIHTLRQDKAVSSKKQAKNRVLSVTGASSEGDVSNSSGKDYNASDWGAWRDKLAE
jgi:hypothetical protein